MPENGLQQLAPVPISTSVGDSSAPSGFQKRIDRLVREKGDALRRVQTLESEAAELRRTVKAKDEEMTAAEGMILRLSKLISRYESKGKK